VGLIILLMWVGSLAVLGGPAFLLGVVACVKGARNTSFWLGAAASAIVSVAVQHAVVLFPFVRAGEYSWDLVVALFFGWQLIGPPIVAMLAWLVGRSQQRPALQGTAAGLLFSVPVAIALAVPVALVVPPLLGLHATH
jgi:hypothetical protein